MRKHKVDLILHGFPNGRSVRMGVFDVGFGTTKEIAKEVGEDVDNGLVWRKRRDIVSNVLSCTDLVTKVQFEPGVEERSKSVPQLMMGINHSDKRTIRLWSSSRPRLSQGYLL